MNRVIHKKDEHTIVRGIICRLSFKVFYMYIINRGIVDQDYVQDRT